MDVDKLLAQVCGEARALGIPLAADILPQVRLNFRAVARFGCCVKTREGH
ncbi:sprT domain-containing protein, partial [Bacteroides thetaiotaomicron]